MKGTLQDRLRWAFGGANGGMGDVGVLGNFNLEMCVCLKIVPVQG